MSAVTAFKKIKMTIDLKVNITGCGYIGKKIAAALSVNNQRAACFVLSEESEKTCESLGLNVFKTDLDKVDLSLTACVSEKFENSVIAYLVPPPAKGKIDTRMYHFISVLEKLSNAPEKILLISTTGVYGDCKGRWIDETQMENPQADRAHRRLSAELQLKEYCEKEQVECVIFRVPGIYSADKLPVKRITSGEAIVCAEDSGYTNRIHADDLTAFCVEALISQIRPGVYNCCDGRPSTMHDYFIRVAAAMNLPRPEEISLQQAHQELSPGMLSYLAESKRISNKKLLSNFKTRFEYPDLDAGLIRGALG